MFFIWLHWESLAGRALGVRPIAIDDGALTLGFDPEVDQAGRTEDCVDLAALPVLIDQSMGLVLRLAHDIDLPLLTVDFRVDWLDAPRPEELMTCRAKVLGRRGRLVLVATEIVGGDARIIGHSTGQMLLGTYPGGSQTSGGNGVTILAGPRAQNFDEHLGLEIDAERARLPPQSRFTGAVHLPSYHGGVIAGASQKVAEAYLAKSGAGAFACSSLSVRFLRPAPSGTALVFDVKEIRRGATLAILTVTTRLEGGQDEIAVTDLTFSQGHLDAFALAEFEQGWRPHAGASDGLVSRS